MSDIKLIIFDLDGVLVETKMLHFHALNDALFEIDPKYCISIEDHLLKYDGLSTSKKLNILNIEKQLDSSLNNKINKLKQMKTIERLNSEILENKYSMFKELSNKYQIAIASNSIRGSIKKIIERLGIANFIDRYYSNEDVRNPKPHPEIYMKAMLDFGVSPSETLIIEDSPIGRQAAIESGAILMGVNTPLEVNISNIYEFIKHQKKNKTKWQGKNMNILIPMAGAGSRFEKAGYTFPKPLIEVNGKPMIQLVVENLNIDGNYIFIVQKGHREKYNLDTTLNLISPKCKIYEVDGITEGAACTTLLAKESINTNSSLLIANSDQFVKWNSDEFLYSAQSQSIDGAILTFESTHPKWSYVKTDQNRIVTEVAEKNPISNTATVGIYFWKRGSDYVKYAEQMINKNIRYNNEFYVCPVFNEAIQDGKIFKTFQAEKMWGLGTPEDLQYFIKDRE